MNKYKEQLRSEEEKNDINIELEFNTSLNKGINKYNCLTLWEIDILNTNEERLDRAAEKTEKDNTNVFNRRKATVNRNDPGTFLASEAKVKNFMDFRKSQLQNRPRYLSKICNINN